MIHLRGFHNTRHIDLNRMIGEKLRQEETIIKAFKATTQGEGVPKETILMLHILIPTMKLKIKRKTHH